MIALAALLLLLQAPPEWSVSDKTDNDTGERSVSALTFNEDRSRNFVILYLDCSERYGRPALFVDWMDLPIDEWMVLHLDDDKTEGFDLPVFMKEEDRGRLIHWGDTDALLSDIPDGARLRITAYRPGYHREATFVMGGLHKAWERVKTACPTI